jgi:hypothetical protein
LGDAGFDRLAIYDVSAAGLGWLRATSKEVTIGVATTTSLDGMGAWPATSIRASLAVADVTGNVKAASAALRANNDQSERDERRCITPA